MVAECFRCYRKHWWYLPNNILHSPKYNKSSYERKTINMLVAQSSHAKFLQIYFQFHTLNQAANIEYKQTTLLQV